MAALRQRLLRLERLTSVMRSRVAEVQPTHESEAESLADDGPISFSAALCQAALHELESAGEAEVVLDLSEALRVLEAGEEASSEESYLAALRRVARFERDLEVPAAVFERFSAMIARRPSAPEETYQRFESEEAPSATVPCESPLPDNAQGDMLERIRNALTPKSCASSAAPRADLV